MHPRSEVRLCWSLRVSFSLFPSSSLPPSSPWLFHFLPLPRLPSPCLLQRRPPQPQALSRLPWLAPSISPAQRTLQVLPLPPRLKVPSVPEPPATSSQEGLSLSTSLPRVSQRVRVGITELSHSGDTPGQDLRGTLLPSARGRPGVASRIYSGLQAPGLGHCPGIEKRPGNSSPMQCFTGTTEISAPRTHNSLLPESWGRRWPRQRKKCRSLEPILACRLITQPSPGKRDSRDLGLGVLPSGGGRGGGDFQGHQRGEPSQALGQALVTLTSRDNILATESSPRLQDQCQIDVSHTSPNTPPATATLGWSAGMSPSQAQLLISPGSH